MTIILSVLVVASILAMAWSFLASGRLEAKIEEFERRMSAPLPPPDPLKADPKPTPEK